MAFSALADIRPMIETMPLERTADVYERMTSGAAWFRMVITTGHPVAIGGGHRCARLGGAGAREPRPGVVQVGEVIFWDAVLLVVVFLVWLRWFLSAELELEPVF